MKTFSPIRMLAPCILAMTLMPLAARGQEPPDPSVSEPANPKANDETQSLPQHVVQLPTAKPPIHKARINWYLRQLKHPLTPRDQEMRAAVRKLGKSHWHFVHVELQGHKVLTGNIIGVSDEGFNLETGILGAGRFVAYREVATSPREVAAVGTRTLRGVEWTGFATLCVAAIPLALLFYPLVLAGVIQD